jgi:hypothetical protein
MEERNAVFFFIFELLQKSAEYRNSDSLSFWKLGMEKENLSKKTRRK